VILVILMSQCLLHAVPRVHCGRRGHTTLDLSSGSPRMAVAHELWQRQNACSLRNRCSLVVKCMLALRPPGPELGVFDSGTECTGTGCSSSSSGAFRGNRLRVARVLSHDSSAGIEVPRSSLSTPAPLTPLSKRTCGALTSTKSARRETSSRVSDSESEAALLLVSEAAVQLITGFGCVYSSELPM
jgi:hypothetical protein